MQQTGVRFIICRSLTTAQRALFILTEAGIQNGMRRIPPREDLGCGYGITVREDWLEDALDILRECGIAFGDILYEYKDGTYGKVR